MADGTAEQLAKSLQKRFNHSTDAETHATIITIWLAGVMQRLISLGVISGGKMKEVDGIDQWDEIDKHRYRLIPPNVLGYCLTGFVKVAAVKHLQEKLGELIAAYYTDAGRQQITAVSLDRIFLNSPTGK